MTVGPPAEVLMSKSSEKASGSNLASATAGGSERERADESCLDYCSGSSGGCLCFSADMCMNFSSYLNDCCGYCCAGI